ncbi:hypothetical protein NWE55_03745 [Myroides albus]|uniref:Uncharacterized protein n=1 Tax=Myroides albus TaxID=2562892 RepID=A0A6I3LUC9_9FLAO|nr:hypothetical protein [Myroides albus]MTG99522.1 hypothetical protein [Myroides albus]UVD80394.1 hypothetical protein NWE55_03745 [Myroides albus]
MEISITSKLKINNISIGDKKKVISETNNGITYYYELNSRNEIKTISVRSCYEFILDNKKVNWLNFKELLDTHTHIEIPDDTFYFEELDLIVWLNKSKKIFNELLIFNQDLKKSYEDYFNSFIVNKKVIKKIENDLYFAPFVGINSFYFGENIEELILLDEQEINILPSRYYVDEKYISFRFDKMLLSQIMVNRYAFEGKIYFKELNLKNKKDLDNLIDREFKIERKTHWVFPNIGMVLSKDKRELYFVDRVLLEFWKMINRPITSW